MPNTTPLKKRKLLLIDDDPRLLLGLKAVMSRKGFNILAANSGTEGLQLARENLPDAIVCDVMMPAPNGFQIQKMLATDKLTSNIPFIFLTARTSVADKIAGIEQGADDYITKPFNADELAARIEAILRRNEIGHQQGLREMEGDIEKIKHAISANLEHELRTPLTVILANLEMALREKFASQSKDMKEYLESSLSSAHRLSMLVEDLILLSDIDQGTLSCARLPIDLEESFNRPIREVCAHYQEKRLNIQTDIMEDIVIHAAPHEFSLAVSHLVDNACKFSPDKARIWIQLRRNGLGGCILTVENEGLSIPENLRGKVFERYYQIQQGDDRSYNGLGLGLTIAQAVASACGGSVSIQDSEIGCKVRLMYPPV